MEKRRTVIKLDRLSLYEEADIRFEDIKKGDVFRLYDDVDGEVDIVKDENDNTIFFALEDAHDGKVNCVSYQEYLDKEFEELEVK
jgi:hypothetical protein